MEAPRLLAGRYRLLAVRGSGIGSLHDDGIATVWHARDEVVGRRVTVRTVATAAFSDPGVLDRFRDETKTATTIRHFNVCDMYDSGETYDINGEPELFTVTEFLGDMTLEDRLAGGRMPWRIGVELCSQIAAGLSAAHAAGLPHRQLTPSDVVITLTGPKITNLGTSTVRSGSSLSYLAPEQVRDGVTAGGPAADVFALGLLLYQTLTGTLPDRPPRTRDSSPGHHRRDRSGQAGQAQLASEAGQANFASEAGQAQLASEAGQADQAGERDPAGSPDQESSFGTLPPVPGLPIEVASLCRRCLRLAPGDRPTSATLASELAAIVRLPVSVVATPLARHALPGDPPPCPAGAGPATEELPLTGSNTVTVPALPSITAAGDFRRATPRHASEPDPADEPRPLSAGAVFGIWAVSGLLLIALVTAAIGMALRTDPEAITATDRTPAPLPSATFSASSTDPSAQSTEPSTDSTRTSPPSQHSTRAATAEPASGPADCSIRLSVDTAWEDGATVQLTIVNTGEVPIQGWSLAFTLAGGLRAGPGWNGVWSQHDETVTIHDAGYNASLAPGETIGNIGANLSGRAPGHTPLAHGFTLNGTTCRGP